MKRRQRTWTPHGWHLMATIGQGGGLGLSWVSPVRWNGFSLLLGPLIIDIQPPMPKWMADQISTEK